MNEKKTKYLILFTCGIEYRKSILFETNILRNSNSKGEEVKQAKKMTSLSLLRSEDIYIFELHGCQNSAALKGHRLTGALGSKKCLLIFLNC